MENVARMGKLTNSKFCLENLKGREYSRRRVEDQIGMDIRIIGWETVD